MERINLTDDERALIRRSEDKVGYLGIVEHRGSRGGRFRPVRTTARITLERAEEEFTELCQKQLYRRGTAQPVFVARKRFFIVDALGRIQAEETR